MWSTSSIHTFPVSLTYLFSLSYSLLSLHPPSSRIWLPPSLSIDRLPTSRLPPRLNSVAMTTTIIPCSSRTRRGGAMTREGRATVAVAWRARSTVERHGGGAAGQTRGGWHGGGSKHGGGLDAWRLGAVAGVARGEIQGGGSQHLMSAIFLFFIQFFICGIY